jgi:hypothetical protein
MAISSIQAVSKEQKKIDRIALDEQIKDINKKFTTLLQEKIDYKFRMKIADLVKAATEEQRKQEWASDKIITPDPTFIKDPLTIPYETTLVYFLNDSYGENATEAIQLLKKINYLTRKTLRMPETTDINGQKRKAEGLENAKTIALIIKKLYKDIDSINSIFSPTPYQKRYALELTASYAIGIFNTLKRFLNMAETVSAAAKGIADIATKERKSLKIPTDAEIKVASEKALQNIK